MAFRGSEESRKIALNSSCKPLKRDVSGAFQERLLRPGGPKDAPDAAVAPTYVRESGLRAAVGKVCSQNKSARVCDTVEIG